VNVYKTILIPLDTTPADETILRHIRGLARLCGSRLVLVHVADGHVARNQSTLNLADSQEMRDDREYLSRRAEELTGDGFEATFRLACGDPAREILKIAAAEGCDLIAMSTHGHGPLKDLILGTVASEVRHKTDIPVLLVRRRSER
jgi:nucleotide-binding universal stress UspA family protein